MALDHGDMPVTLHVCIYITLIEHFLGLSWL